ncbi:DUF4232 domain-containing protein [Streptomyces pratensis]|uniref:DUF4232 domain-containing protein n=1 Tax=Streptomyces pratensis TaxID=1169025 RepID=UPI003019338F
MGERVRAPGAAVLSAVALMALTGCSGFLVPAGEGVAGPSPSASPSASLPGPGIVRAKTPPPAPGQSTPAKGALGLEAPASPPPGGCPASGVVVDMGQVQTAMMHRAVVLTLTNCGSEPYAVDGYPSIRALGEDGGPIPVKVNLAGSYFGQDPGPEPVSLAPGRSVRSVLAWVSTPEGGDLIEGDALEISAAPRVPARVFPLEGHDIRLMDELNMTAWRTEPAT